MAHERILVVEDDFVTIKLLQKILSNNNFDIVDCVTNGLDVIKIINEKTVDLILMDININGDNDGLEIAEKIKTRYNIPLIFITSHTDQVTIDSAINSGAFGYIVKPFTKDDLLIAIRIALYRFVVEKKTDHELVNLSTQLNTIKNVVLIDSLTNVYNRNGFLEKSVLIDKKDNYPLGIFTIDINGLKSINENFGNKTGDMLLIKVASKLTELCGPKAIISRSGADSFLCLIPKIDTEFMEMLHFNLIEKCEIEIQVSFSWSFSCGYEIKTIEDRRLEELTVSAEHKMNWHKFTQPDSIRSLILKSAFISFIGKTYETKEHCLRLKENSTRFGLKLKLDNHSLVKLTILSELHDIGKIGIPERILAKKEKLNDDEWIIMKGHSEIGYEIVKGIDAFEGISYDVLCIHERWDGKGYPGGLAKEQIPLNSRIIAIVDAYDAMISDRVYRSAMSKEDALLELGRNAGTQFDPSITDVFITMIRNDGFDFKNYIVKKEKVLATVNLNYSQNNILNGERKYETS